MPHNQAVLVRRVLEDGQMPQNAVTRFRTEGIADLRDCSSRPHKLHNPAPEHVIRQIEALRCPRWPAHESWPAAEPGISHPPAVKAQSPSPRVGPDQGYRPRLRIAISATDSTRWSTVTSRSWDVSRPPSIESPDGTPACTEAGAQNGNTCMSASMTTPAGLFRCDTRQNRTERNRLSLGGCCLLSKLRNHH